MGNLAAGERRGLGRRIGGKHIALLNIAKNRKKAKRKRREMIFQNSEVNQIRLEMTSAAIDWDKNLISNNFILSIIMPQEIV